MDPSASTVLERLADHDVLIVEDDDDTRDVLSMLLSREGYRVAAVSSAHAAIDFLAQTRTPPRLALLDVVMPGMTGLELVREIRNEPRFDEVHLAIISGVPPGPEPEQRHVDAWLLKPPSVGELLGLVEGLVTRPDSN